MILLAVAPLLLSEVLANEPGSVTSLEFVELVARHPVREGFAILDANGKTVGVPAVALDSGGYLVVCRDEARFEQHFGDSSGTWGDSDIEDYALQEVAMSLPNGQGYVSLVWDQVEDRFDWSGDAPDGVSYERVSDSLWQTTDPDASSTPGRRNSGIAPDFDWSIEEIKIHPTLPRSGAPAQVTVGVRNLGRLASSGEMLMKGDAGDTLLAQAYAGEPGVAVRLYADVIPRSGLNVLHVSLSGDDRAANDTAHFAYYADVGPLVFSEFYPAPSASQPEWLELFAPAGFQPGASTLAVADVNDTTKVPSERWPPGDVRYVLVTADSVLFALAYPGVSVPVIQPPRWPSLNNDGDTLVLLLQGAAIDRAAYPATGSRRGVAFERVGTSDVWGWSVAESGSTPGKANSIDVTYADRIDVDVEPNPFAAGQGELANFQYRVPFGAVADLRLFRGDGRPVRTLFDRRPVVSGQVIWNGQGDDGALVPVGIYIVQFRLFEPQEQVYLSTVAVAR